jgi:hypothetical protein
MMTIRATSIRRKQNIAIVVFLIGALSFSAFAQGSIADWDRVTRLAVGTPLIIQTGRGNHRFGRFKSADDSTIVLQQESGDISIDTRSVKKIYLALHKKKHGAKILSTLTFFGVGMLLNLADERISPDWPTIVPLIGAAGAAALVQTRLTKGFKKGALIYRVN